MKCAEFCVFPVAFRELQWAKIFYSHLWETNPTSIFNTFVQFQTMTQDCFISGSMSSFKQGVKRTWNKDFQTSLVLRSQSLLSAEG